MTIASHRNRHSRNASLVDQENVTIDAISPHRPEHSHAHHSKSKYPHPPTHEHAQPTLHLPARVLDPESLLPLPPNSAWSLGLSFSAALAKVVRVLERERAAVAEAIAVSQPRRWLETESSAGLSEDEYSRNHIHHSFSGSREGESSRSLAVDEKDSFWLREAEGSAAALVALDAEIAGDATGESTEEAPDHSHLRPIEVHLGELMRSARATRSDRSPSHQEFEVLHPNPAVIALDEVEEKELEPHDPWEHVDWDEDRNEETICPQPPSYAEIAGIAKHQSQGRIELD